MKMSDLSVVSSEELNDVVIEFVRNEVLGVHEVDEVVIPNLPEDVALSNELEGCNSAGVVLLSSCTAIGVVLDCSASTGFK